MNKIYDIHSDQLKCNFCTNYFKCTLHYANLQRYSLKACEKCITNFTYTVLHPSTYQIFRVMLLDAGVTIPFGDMTAEGRTDEESVREELGLVKEEINNKISSFYEEKIRGLMKEMNRIKENIRDTFQAMEKMYVQISQHNSSEKMQELKARLERLKAYETIDIIDEKGKLLEKSEKKATHSSSLRSGNKISSSYQSKQNVSCNRQNKVAKSIKSRCGFQPQASARLMTSRSKSRVLDKTRINQSIVKSIKLDGSRQLDRSIEVSSANYEEWDRAEVSRMLEEKIVFQTYMPREVIKQTNSCLKSQGSRNIVQSVLEMKSRTALSDELIELVGGDAAKTNFSCYLKTLRDHKQVKTVRMIRCSLVDADLDQLLNFLADSNELQTLIITNNRLTELSIEALLSFKSRHPQSRLSTVYIGNNYINSFRSSAILRRQPNCQLTIHL